jgi:rhodanese-related sulfurtransferase
MPSTTPTDSTVPRISRDELHAKITRGEPFALLEVLPKPYWRKHHLPGARNLPPDQVRELAPQLVPDKGAEVVLYCWNDT